MYRAVSETRKRAKYYRPALYLESLDNKNVLFFRYVSSCVFFSPFLYLFCSSVYLFCFCSLGCEWTLENKRNRPPKMLSHDPHSLESSITSCSRRPKINSYLYFQHESIKVISRSIYLIASASLCMGPYCISCFFPSFGFCSCLPVNAPTLGTKQSKTQMLCSISVGP